MSAFVFLLLSVVQKCRSDAMLTSDALMNELKKNPIDPNSFSRPDLCRVTHIEWKASVDFEKHIINGFVELTAVKQNEKTSELILDTSGLTIESIVDTESDQSLTYELSSETQIKRFGSKLTVKLLAKHQSIIRISYETSNKASALQWLEPEQTVGKRKPYLFSQGNTRSMMPCQDTPAVKATYNATISVPKDLVALLSAVRVGDGSLSADGLRKDYQFRQSIPTPSYLIAIVVADLVSKQIGPRSHVWSEPELIDISAYEFADTEKILATAESIVGPYVWGVYDLLVLPPSFPYNGMENPCLTFLSPTLIAGDRSLSNIVAHEIAHSWTGNLVTNKNRQHFWLNEGFTTFLERKILGRLAGGEANRQFKSILGLKALKFEIVSMGSDNPFTKLVIDLRGVDPIIAYSNVPYEKGSTFLYILEQRLGGTKVFDVFIRKYIENFKFKSIDSKDFKAFLYSYFKNKKHILDAIDWNEWLNGTGMPPILPDYDNSLVRVCTELANRWISAEDEDLSEFKDTDLSPLDAWQVIEFLNQLLERQPQISQIKYQFITEVYGFKSTRNYEIKSLWIRVGLRIHSKICIEEALAFVTSNGKIKFLRPIYRALYEWEETRQQAIDTFKAHSSQLMQVSQSVAAKELHLNPDNPA